MEKFSERVWLLRAPNPGPMTLTGTNTWLVGANGALVVIDPGEATDSHIHALVRAAQNLNSKIEGILVTHGHPDHYPGAVKLKELCGAPIVAYRDSTFTHDENLVDGQRYEVAGVSFICYFTPGHAEDHLCFYLEQEDALFTGDNILGFGTTVVAPPKGNMSDYLRSLALLQQRCGDAKVIYGGHGPAIISPAAKFVEYINHRQKRLSMVLAALADGSQTIPEIVAHVYKDTDSRLWPVAARQVMAQLQYLEEQHKVASKEGRAPTPEEDELLNPVGIIDEVARAELGIGERGEMLRFYRLLDK